MKRVALLAVGLVAAGVVAVGVWAARTGFYSPPRTIVQFAYIKSITPLGKGYQVKVDPAYFLEGLTAQRAAAEDGTEVDNDYYILNPDHRLLTYRLSAAVPATVLTNTSSGIASTRVPIAELAQIVLGKNPKHRPLLESGSLRTLGYWVKTSIDTVQSIDQQYQP